MAAMQEEITLLLLKWSRGDSSALDQLIPMVYPELRRLARRYMRKENPEHTLQTSALINEAYLRLIDQRAVEWHDRSHFFAVSAQVMRHILIDHARKYSYAKRGAGAKHIALDEVSVLKQERAGEFVALDDALVGLAKIDPRKARIVELRFFGGLTVEETAEVLKLAPITVKREWRAARAWLFRELSSNSVQVT
jgi:RNA polymerase sigma factor (TIGR02999 family)